MTERREAALKPEQLKLVRWGQIVAHADVMGFMLPLLAMALRDMAEAGFCDRADYEEARQAVDTLTAVLDRVINKLQPETAKPA